MTCYATYKIESTEIVLIPCSLIELQSSYRLIYFVFRGKFSGQIKMIIVKLLTIVLKPAVDFS